METATRQARPHEVGPQTPGADISNFTGELVTPDHPEYDRARALWNGAVDHKPLMVAGCRSTADVVAAVRFARERDLRVSVRGGGHGVAGDAVRDGGIVIDLSLMKAVAIDPAALTATVAGGVRWGELDAATQAFGLATTGGGVSDTGVAGLTLGGGIGWLMRRHGLTVDNVLSAEVVTADGHTFAASERDNPDLFWGLRGGGGGLGVVTSFTYQLHSRRTCSTGHARRACRGPTDGYCGSLGSPASRRRSRANQNPYHPHLRPPRPRHEAPLRG